MFICSRAARTSKRREIPEKRRTREGEETDVFICDAAEHVLAMTIKTPQIHPRSSNFALFHHIRRVKTAVNPQKKIHIKQSAHTGAKFLDSLIYC